MVFLLDGMTMQARMLAQAARVRLSCRDTTASNSSPDAPSGVADAGGNELFVLGTLKEPFAT